MSHAKTPHNLRNVFEHVKRTFVSEHLRETTITNASKTQTKHSAKSIDNLRPIFCDCQLLLWRHTAGILLLLRKNMSQNHRLGLQDHVPGEMPHAFALLLSSRSGQDVVCNFYFMGLVRPLCLETFYAGRDVAWLCSSMQNLFSLHNCHCWAQVTFNQNVGFNTGGFLAYWQNDSIGIKSNQSSKSSFSNMFEACDFKPCWPLFFERRFLNQQFV